MAQKMYVDVNEIMKDWGCSRAKGYQIIAELNAQLLKMNPHSIIIQGKCNRKWYLENCYGALDDEDEVLVDALEGVNLVVKLYEDCLGSHLPVHAERFLWLGHVLLQSEFLQGKFALWPDGAGSVHRLQLDANEVFHLAFCVG